MEPKISYLLTTCGISNADEKKTKQKETTQSTDNSHSLF